MTELLSKRLIFLILLLSIIFINGCNKAVSTPQIVIQQSAQLPTKSITQLPSQISILPQNPTTTSTITAESSIAPSPTATQLVVVTSPWTYHEAGSATVPILLYHHIADIEPTSRYAVSLDNFRNQIQKLSELRYETITPGYLADVITKGGLLPERPIIITFDDGSIDVYNNAFRVMKEKGFVGAFYIVSSYIGANDIVTPTQLIEMAADGWEIGSHSMSHNDLTKSSDQLSIELLQSRKDIEKITGLEVTSFAYPYGLANSEVINKTYNSKYKTAMGLGKSVTHSEWDLFYLNRREVQGTMTLELFLTLLPWTLP